jgi:hypothetical protein
MKKICFLFLLATSTIAFGQDDSDSNLQNYTPSKLLEKGKIDIKWFNNLYTETQKNDRGNTFDIDRQNFFTTSLEIFTGISESRKFNVGVIIDLRSNSFAGQSATSVFSFKNELGKSRTGIAHIAPSIKFAPFKRLSNFSVQSSFFIPLHDKESNENGYLAEKSFIFQNRFFYDYTFESRKFQLFSELNSRFFFGEKSIKDGAFNPKGGYANNSLELTPGVFLSYFDSNKFTVLGFAQQAVLIDLGNKYSKEYTAAGFGAKYQLTKILNVETLYSKFLRGKDTGLGESFNFGLRAIF